MLYFFYISIATNLRPVAVVYIQVSATRREAFLPCEEPSSNGTGDDHVLAAQVELARHEE